MSGKGKEPFPWVDRLIKPHAPTTPNKLKKSWLRKIHSRTVTDSVDKKEVPCNIPQEKQRQRIAMEKPDHGLLYSSSSRFLPSLLLPSKLCRSGRLTSMLFRSAILPSLLFPSLLLPLFQKASLRRLLFLGRGRAISSPPTPNVAGNELRLVSSVP